jgi:hypothetical protein
MLQEPCSRSPSKAAKQAGESKRGQQSQSIEPFLLTGAALFAIANHGVIFNE